MTKCDDCGKEFSIGEWPFCPHGYPSKGTTSPFIPYFDIGLGQQINTQAERWSHMRKLKCDYRGSKMGTKGCEV